MLLKVFLFFKLLQFVSTQDILVVGGTKADPNKFPYQISLQFNNRHLCGGSIVHQLWILTAAHCIPNDKNVTGFTVVVGTISLQNTDLRYNAHKAITYGSVGNFRNDLALVKLAKQLNFTNSVRPINLPQRHTPGGTSVILSGWGFTSNTPPTNTDDLQWVELKTITNQECAKQYQNSSTSILFDNICTTSPVGKGACFGDSGGPLVDPQNKWLVGIVSEGVPCALGLPDIYTRVSTFTAWIQLTILLN